MIAPIRFSREARRDLEQIWRYSFETWGEERADLYVTEIDGVLRMISENTGIARSAAHIRLGLWRYPVGSHIIYFRVAEASIRVVRILHARMDVGRHL